MFRQTANIPQARSAALKWMWCLALLVNVGVLCTAVIAGEPGPPDLPARSRAGGEEGVLFRESFDDDRLLERGWYDGRTFKISGEGTYAGSGCIEYHWKPDTTSPDSSSGVRHLFAPTDTVYLRFYIKLSKGWGWTGRSYHPHLSHFMTTENSAYHGPASSHLTLYIEPQEGRLRLGATDMQNADMPHGLTQGPLQGGYNGMLYDSQEILFTDAKWHCVEAMFKLNSLDVEKDKPNADGIVRGWFDGKLMVDRNDVIFRTTDLPNMKFNQFLLTPYFGPGLLPHEQTLWIDELVVATERTGSLAAKGPLRVHPTNPRYFIDGSGRAIYLTGSHTWANLVDIGPSDPPPRFDFDAYLDWMKLLNHNFIRMWTWEPVTWNTKANQENKLHTAAPQPWARTGPGKALDGKPKFNLEKFNPAYFDRLRNRVEAAGNRGIYVSIMLFEGWAMQFSAGAWQGHPFHPDNNVNGIDGDVNKAGYGLEIYTLANKAVTSLQEAYVRKVIDTVNDLDTVLYEISNENHPESTQWQYHVIRYIKQYEKTKPKQHPVGMTFQYRGGKNQTLFESPADWISPNPEGGYRDDPPAVDGRKVVLNDTDHLWGIGGNQAWVWKSFTRGYNPLFMDPYDGEVLGQRLDPRWDPIRKSLGYTLMYTNKMNLAAMQPRNDLASTKYCLANPGVEYLVYNPDVDAPSITVNLAGGTYYYEWFNPNSGKIESTGTIKAGDNAQQTIEAPFKGDGVLYLAHKTN